MEPFVPIYLDGDAKGAQHQAERLKVAAYPSMLVLNSNGEEVMRIMESVNETEFAVALKSALVASRPLAKTIELATLGKASPEDWRVIALSRFDILGLSEQELLKLHAEMAAAVPYNMQKERALLAARLLETAANSTASETKSKVADDAQTYLGRIFATPETKYAARSILISSNLKNIVSWLHPLAEGPEYEALKEQWLHAARALSETGSLSVENQLSAECLPLFFEQLEHPDGPVPGSIRDRIVAAANKTDERSRTSHQRKSAMWWAAALLRSVDDYDGARKLLDKELKTTDAPWYYSQIYATLEAKAGNEAASLKWSEKARGLAKGRATKLQWIVSDLQANAKAQPIKESHLAQLTKGYYSLAFSLEDGFSGRNATRAGFVAEALKSYNKEGPVAKVLASYARACREGKSKDGTKCRAHFAPLVDMAREDDMPSECDGTCGI
jgi:hypothetical protein